MFHTNRKAPNPGFPSGGGGGEGSWLSHTVWPLCILDRRLGCCQGHLGLCGGLPSQIILRRSPLDLKLRYVYCP